MYVFFKCIQPLSKPSLSSVGQFPTSYRSSMSEVITEGRCDSCQNDWYLTKTVFTSHFSHTKMEHIMSGATLVLLNSKPLQGLKVTLKL